MVGVRGAKTNEAGALGDALQIIISHGATPLYGNGSLTGAKTLTQFFADSTSAIGVPLLDLAPGVSATLTFTVLFAPEAGNVFQASNVVFDITLGVSVAVPEECQEIAFDGLPIFGTLRGERLRGTSGNDLIFALEGGDSVRGGGGDDCILGGDGGDSLQGEGGNDVLVGGAGGDSVQGGAGDDVLMGGEGGDGLKGDGGDDELFGEGGSDGLQGGAGNDVLVGGSGSDAARGQAGSDACEAEVERTCEV
jgi:Ca2+-binding RTX toxin-like protein